MVKCGVCQEDFTQVQDRKQHMEDKHKDWLQQFEKPTDLLGRIQQRLDTPPPVVPENRSQKNWRT